jgi:hypothetical protein
MMDTSTNMTPPPSTTALSKLEFVKYDGREKQEHAMLCHALQRNHTRRCIPSYTKEAMDCSRL